MLLSSHWIHILKVALSQKILENFFVAKINMYSKSLSWEENLNFPLKTANNLFKFSAQDSDLEYLCWRSKKFPVSSDVKPPRLCSLKFIYSERAKKIFKISTFLFSSECRSKVRWRLCKILWSSHTCLLRMYELWPMCIFLDRIMNLSAWTLPVWPMSLSKRQIKIYLLVILGAKDWKHFQSCLYLELNSHNYVGKVWKGGVKSVSITFVIRAAWETHSYQDGFDL